MVYIKYQNWATKSQYLSRDFILSIEQQILFKGKNYEIFIENVK